MKNIITIVHWRYVLIHTLQIGWMCIEKCNDFSTYWLFFHFGFSFLSYSTNFSCFFLIQFNLVTSSPPICIYIFISFQLFYFIFSSFIRNDRLDERWINTIITPRQTNNNSNLWVKVSKMNDEIFFLLN